MYWKLTDQWILSEHRSNIPDSPFKLEQIKNLTAEKPFRLSSNADRALAELDDAKDLEGTKCIIKHSILRIKEFICATNSHETMSEMKLNKEQRHFFPCLYFYFFFKCSV